MDYRRCPRNKGEISQCCALPEYAQQFDNRNEAIKAAYASGGTLKLMGDYFQLNYSRVSKIVTKSKACSHVFKAQKKVHDF